MSFRAVPRRRLNVFVPLDKLVVRSPIVRLFVLVHLGELHLARVLAALNWDILHLQILLGNEFIFLCIFVSNICQLHI